MKKEKRKPDYIEEENEEFFYDLETDSQNIPEINFAVSQENVSIEKQEPHQNTGQ